MLITSFVSATLPAIPTPKGIIISSAFARSTASSSALEIKNLYVQIPKL